LNGRQTRPVDQADMPGEGIEPPTFGLQNRGRAPPLSDMKRRGPQ